MFVERNCLSLHLGYTVILASSYLRSVGLEFKFTELLALLIGVIDDLEFALESVLVLEFVDLDLFDAGVVAM